MSTRFPDEDRTPTWKIAFLQSVVAGAFFVLLVGYWRLQIGQHRTYLELAERNRIRNLPVIAPRGRVFDRHGRVLADNYPAFTVLLLREGTSSLSAERIEGIARSLKLNPSEVQRVVERSARLPRFQPVILKSSATLEDISFVESHRVEYPELDIIQIHQRVYPEREVAAAVLGYVGEVSEEMIAKAGSRYRPGDVVGLFGVERTYNEILSGRDGMRRVVVDSRGREVGSLTTINALPGSDLRLTLDLDVQMAAEASLGPRAGAVVALDARTGEILAMASHPGFDPNDFARRIDREEWKRLTSDPMKPLMNKAIQARLAPGSVFKIVTGAAALETGTIKPSFTIHCPGAITLYGHTYRDWRQNHGTVNFHRAIVISCDVYFYTLGKLLGIDTIDYFASELGLGSRTGIDLPGEDAGLMPSRAWVQRAFKRKWWAGETISVAIGQGAVVVTPLQLAYLIGGIVSGGTFRRPHVAFRDRLVALGTNPPANEERRFPLNRGTVEALLDGMWGVVNEDGTGVAARCPGIDIAGKTGTAQVVSENMKKSSRRSEEYKNNAWFVGYAPARKPEIVVAILVMGGEHSTVAAPIARDVIRAYFEQRLPGPPRLVPGSKDSDAQLVSRAPAGGRTEPSTGASERHAYKR